MFHNEIIFCVRQLASLWNIMELPPHNAINCGGSSIMFHNEINCLCQTTNFIIEHYGTASAQCN